eukprot:4125-Heterococcus_DN1.PRE.6
MYAGNDAEELPAELPDTLEVLDIAHCYVLCIRPIDLSMLPVSLRTLRVCSAHKFEPDDVRSTVQVQKVLPRCEAVYTESHKDTTVHKGAVRQQQQLPTQDIAAQQTLNGKPYILPHNCKPSIMCAYISYAWPTRLSDALWQPQAATKPKGKEFA